MFAVKGWNISAPLKQQTAHQNTKVTKVDGQLAAGDGKRSKKRKRKETEDDAETGGRHALLKSTSQSKETERSRPTQKAENVISSKSSKKGTNNPTKANAGAIESHDSRDSRPDGDRIGVKKSKKKAPRDSRRDLPDISNITAQISATLSEKATKKHKGGGEKKDKSGSSQAHDLAVEISSQAAPANNKIEELGAPAGLTPLQSAMRQKLISSRFRHLNETLYTTPSSSSVELFKNNPSFFNEYHDGFARQVSTWPENPVDGFVRLVLCRGSIENKGYVPGRVKGSAEKGKLKQAAAELVGSGGSGDAAAMPPMGAAEPLPRDFQTRNCTLADIGCGQASLARQLETFARPLRLTVHSFDLAVSVAADSEVDDEERQQRVTVADARALPLPDGSVDVAIFSLALMGTNWIEFVEEAWRVLRWKGECWIADVNSRFAGAAEAARRLEHSVGKRVKGKKGPAKAEPPQHKAGEDPDDEGTVEQEGVQERVAGGTTDVSAFVAVLQRRGFELLGQADLSNKMFARMRFSKSLTPARGKCKPADKKPRFGPGKSRFIDKQDADSGISVQDEAKVLKPCVYKTR